MALSFFRRSPPEAEVSSAVAGALTQLERLSTEQPTLSAPIAILRDVLPVIFHQPQGVQTPTISRELARAKLADGVPLLRGERMKTDAPVLAQRWEAVCRVLARHRQGGSSFDVLLHDSFNPAELLGQLLAGDTQAMQRAAERLRVEVDLLAVVLRLTIFPLLAEVSAALAPLREGVPWDRGDCPTCGSRPLLGELRGLEQSLFLRCGLCASEWPFPRLRCPFCNSTDHRTLGFLSVEGEEDRRRIATCDRCHAYVKLTSTLGALEPPELLVADVATLHLDLIAAERGYSATLDFRED